MISIYIGWRQTKIIWRKWFCPKRYPHGSLLWHWEFSAMRFQLALDLICVMWPRIAMLNTFLCLLSCSGRFTVIAAVNCFEMSSIVISRQLIIDKTALVWANVKYCYDSVDVSFQPGCLSQWKWLVGVRTIFFAIRVLGKDPLSFTGDYSVEKIILRPSFWMISIAFKRFESFEAWTLRSSPYSVRFELSLRWLSIIVLKSFSTCMSALCLVHRNHPFCLSKFPGSLHQHKMTFCSSSLK